MHSGAGFPYAQEPPYVPTVLPTVGSRDRPLPGYSTNPVAVGRVEWDRRRSRRWRIIMNSYSFIVIVLRSIRPELNLIRAGKPFTSAFSSELNGSNSGRGFRTRNLPRPPPRPDPRLLRPCPSPIQERAPATAFVQEAPHYRGTSFMKHNPSLGPYSRLMPRALWWS